jgi:hypothetical protein
MEIEASTLDAFVEVMVTGLGVDIPHQPEVLRHRIEAIPVIGGAEDTIPV